jgi:antitoxin MazE
MPTKLCTWGNSLGVRLPKYVVERTGMRPGDYLFINLTDAGDIVIRPVKAREIHSGHAPVDSPPKVKREADAADLDKW